MATMAIDHSLPVNPSGFRPLNKSTGTLKKDRRGGGEKKKQKRRSSTRFVLSVCRNLAILIVLIIILQVKLGHVRNMTGKQYMALGINSNWDCGSSCTGILRFAGLHRLNSSYMVKFS
jgi:hypothetical protein